MIVNEEKINEKNIDKNLSVFVILTNFAPEKPHHRQCKWY